MKFYTIPVSDLMRMFGLLRFSEKLDTYLSCGREDVLEHPALFEENASTRLLQDKDFSLFQRVTDPNEADIFVVPLYLELIAYWLGPNAGDLIIHLFEFLKTSSKLTIVYWNHDADFSPMNSFVPKNVIVLNHGYTACRGSQDILLPFWNVEIFPDAPKLQFASFIGTPNNNVRRRLVSAIHAYNRPDIIAATSVYGEDYKRAIAMTTFCLCPKGGPGGGGFSYRVFEVLQAGSIPEVLN